MKLKVVTVLSLAIAGSAFANQPYRGPILSRVIGGMEHRGVVTKCEIYADHPKAVGAMKKIKTAMAEKIHTALHIIAQVPSEEYTAYLPEQKANTPQKLHTVLLREDNATLKMRDGADADELVELINEICDAK